MRSDSVWRGGLVALFLMACTTVLEARAPLPLSIQLASERFVAGVLQEIQTPEVLFVPPEQTVFRPEGMPRYAVEKLADYSMASGEKSRQRLAVHKARVVLWGISGQPAPPELVTEVHAFRTDRPRAVLPLDRQYPVPANENQFKAKLLVESRDLAASLSLLQDTLEELQEAALHRSKEPRRWQVQAELVQAALELQMAQFYEYLSMLGSMRKTLPPFDPQLHGGWKLLPCVPLTGDVAGKKLFRDSHDGLERIMREHPGTPYGVLAGRLKEVPIGLEWRATR